MKIMDVYGTAAFGADVEAVSVLIASALGVEFEAHHSSFSNGDYELHESPEYGRLRVLNNVAVDPDDAPCPEFEDYPVIVWVDNPRLPDDLQERLVALRLDLLRRTPYG